MSLVATQGVWMPFPPAINIDPSFSSDVIDATGEKVAFIGRVWNKDRASKNINKVGFRFGAVTKAGGSALTVSLQNVDTSAGPPYRPDGTQDQTVAIANANASFALNTWIQTGALSASRTVSFGELLAVVVEFDGAGRLGADAVNIASLGLGASTEAYLVSGQALFTSSWAASLKMPNVILEFDDGTFGTLDHSWPASALTSTAFNSGSVADETALEFTIPFPCKVDGLWTVVSCASDADFDVVLYDGTTALTSVSVDANTIRTSSALNLVVPIAEQTLSTSATYRLAVKPTTANSVTTYTFDVNDANHFQAHPGGTAWKYTTRVDGGSWAAATATRRMFAGIRISALDAGASNPPTLMLGI